MPLALQPIPRPRRNRRRIPQPRRLDRREKVGRDRHAHAERRQDRLESIDHARPIRLQRRARAMELAGILVGHTGDPHDAPAAPVPLRCGIPRERTPPSGCAMFDPPHRLWFIGSAEQVVADGWPVLFQIVREIADGHPVGGEFLRVVQTVLNERPLMGFGL